MKDSRFKITDSIKSKLELLSKEASRKVLAGDGIPSEPPGGCGGMCQVTCAHYCHAACEGFCGTLSFKA